MEKSNLTRLAASVLLLFGMTAAAHEGEEHQHPTAHHGCLNAIVTCENGHGEVKIDGDTLNLWFVGGGTETMKAVRIPDAQIVLSVTPDGEKKPSRTITLAAVPNELAEEKVGDCSHFVGKADWLKEVKKFTATAEITFRGQRQPLRLEIPNGYDPD